MAATAKRHEKVSTEVDVVRPEIREAGGKDTVIPSPAIALQQTLEQAYVDELPEPSVKKCHPALRLNSLGQLTVVSWAAVLLCARFVRE